ncbi:Small auxin-up RNA [Dillenia turbinata]|uniref:Small auxin-up RNA n=1 Tax=Dillenia turbinata TaxID=194707 RepID=A0AAN8Z8H0_9MAGN
MIIHLEKFIKLAMRRWQKAARTKKRRISSQAQKAKSGAKKGVPTTSDAKRGSFVAYTSDGRKCSIPLSYLDHEIFKQLFKMSKEEFGLQSDGRVRLACDSVFLEYIVLLLRGGIVDEELEQALLVSLATSGCSAAASSSFQHLGLSNRLHVVCT